MKRLFKIIVISCAACLALSACTKKDAPQTDPITEPAPAEASVSNQTQSSDISPEEQARLDAERLEAERARLEQLINQIMSEDVYFDFDRFELTEKAKELLAQVGELLLRETRFTLTIEGHTDDRGTEDYNFTLGAKRAMKVKEFLAAYGIEKDRMESVSYGKEKPKVQGENEEAYSQNRRANFRVNIKK